MKRRELRLLALGAGGLALIVGARVGDTREESVTVGAPDAVEEDDSLVTSGLAPAAPGAGAPGEVPDQLTRVVSDRAIRLMSFGDLEQPPEVCGEGLSDEVAASLESIALSGGESGTIDELNFTELSVSDEVLYGDIDGNGVDEAIIHATCTFGANAREHSIQVWEIGDGVADIAATVPAPGEDVRGPFEPDVISKAFADDGALEITWTRYEDDDPHCCPSGEVTTQYRMVGDEVITVGEPEQS